MSDDWKSIVRAVAPALGTALGGPLVGTAVTAVSNALLGKPDAAVEEVAAAVKAATPDDLLKLKQADQDFAARMKQLDVDVYRIEVDDRASARTMFSANYRPQVYIGGSVIAGFFVVLGVMLTGVAKDLPQAWQAVLPTILGTLAAGFTLVLNFFFGSSFGSKEKTAALAASTPTVPADAPKEKTP